MLWVKSEHVCATCVMWAGERTQMFSFVESGHEGKCLIEGERVTSHKGACQMWYGLPLEFPMQRQIQKEPVSE